MKIGKLAIKALEWIGRVIGIIRTPVGREFLAAVLGRVLGERAPRYLKKLAELEATVGANTSAWPKIEEGARLGQSVVLDADEAKYLHLFKRLWDRNIKTPMTKAGIKLQAPAPTDEELAIAKIGAELIDDGADED